jgi:hypothetical protein
MSGIAPSRRRRRITRPSESRETDQEISFLTLLFCCLDGEKGKARGRRHKHKSYGGYASEKMFIAIIAAKEHMIMARGNRFFPILFAIFIAAPSMIMPTAALFLSRRSSRPPPQENYQKKRL